MLGLFGNMGWVDFLTTLPSHVDPLHAGHPGLRLARLLPLPRPHLPRGQHPHLLLTPPGQLPHLSYSPLLEPILIFTMLNLTHPSSS